MEVVNYKCPNCAAPMTFSIESQRWDCHFCNSSFTKEELDKISASEGREEPERSEWAAEVFGDGDLLAYTCPDCGGRVVADKNTVSTFCTFCHNPTVIASQLSGVYKPAKLLPFKINKEEAIQRFKGLLSRRPFLPKEFINYLDEGEITGLYVPYWLYSADMKGRMTADAKIITVWSDTNYNYQKTDTYALLREGVAPFRLIPADASSRLDDKLMDSIEPFDYNDLEDFTMEYLSGYFAEGFDVSAQQARDRFLSRANSALEQLLRGSASGYHTLIVTSLNSQQINPVNYYAMLPIWTVSITYRDKIYLYAINAQTGKSSGTLPFSVGRFFAWFAGISVGISALVGIALYLGGMFS